MKICQHIEWSFKGFPSVSAVCWREIVYTGGIGTLHVSMCNNHRLTKRSTDQLNPEILLDENRWMALFNVFHLQIVYWWVAIAAKYRYCEGVEMYKLFTWTSSQVHYYSKALIICRDQHYSLFIDQIGRCSDFGQIGHKFCVLSGIVMDIYAIIWQLLRTVISVKSFFMLEVR